MVRMFRRQVTTGVRHGGRKTGPLFERATSMPIPITCPACKTQFKAPDNAAGRKGRCSKCGESLHIPGASVQRPDRAPALVGELSRRSIADEPSAPSMTLPKPLPLPTPVARVPSFEPAAPSAVTSAQRECPYCGEEILATARKCKHCGEILDQALRAGSSAHVTAALPAVVNHIVVQQNASIMAYGAPKSVLLAIILAFFFGPLGMLYSTVPGGVILFVVNVVGGILTFGLILLVTWPAGMVWAGIAAANHNARFSR